LRRVLVRCTNLAGRRLHHRSGHLRANRHGRRGRRRPGDYSFFAVAAVGCALRRCATPNSLRWRPWREASTHTLTRRSRDLRWIIGWDLMLEYSMGCATVASSWSALPERVSRRARPASCAGRVVLRPFTPIEGVAAGTFNLPSSSHDRRHGRPGHRNPRKCPANAHWCSSRSPWCSSSLSWACLRGLEQLDFRAVTERCCPRSGAFGMAKEHLIKESQGSPHRIVRASQTPAEKQLPQATAAMGRAGNQRLLDAAGSRRAAKSRSRKCLSVSIQLPTAARIRRSSID